jgi:hypothetical protein
MYKIVGADRREYGPVTREAVLEWITQGRANAQTIARFEDGPWKPLGTFDEFKDLFATSAATTAPPPTGAPPPISSTTVPPVAPVYTTAPTGRETNQTAIWALVCSILGLFCCPCLPIVSLVLGIVALNQIKQYPNRYSTDVSLVKIAIGISIVAILLHCGVGVFTNGFQQFGKALKFR